jgi:hypothetical protein
MNRGIVIIAHNNRDIDYSLMSIISGGLAKKHLNLPVSLITDQSTVDWMKTSDTFDKASQVFENIKIIDRPVSDNTRRLNDGQEFKTVPFLNSTRSKVWDLTPYDETLLIDSDYLIFSDLLNQYWHLADNVLIGKAMNDVQGQRIGFLDKNVSDVGVHLYWATTVMFKKNKESKLFFDLVKQVEEHYDVFADLYRFSSKQFRNDIAFSVAKHILDGFETTLTQSLPDILTVQDKDLLCEVRDSRLYFIINDGNNPDVYIPCSIKDMDVHFMNKQNIVRQKDKLMELL